MLVHQLKVTFQPRSPSDGRQVVGGALVQVPSHVHYFSTDEGPFAWAWDPEVAEVDAPAFLA